VQDLGAETLTVCARSGCWNAHCVRKIWVLERSLCAQDLGAGTPTVHGLPVASGSDASDGRELAGEVEEEGSEVQDAEEPNSFSRVNLAFPDDDIKREFPLFPVRSQPIPIVRLASRGGSSPTAGNRFVHEGWRLNCHAGVGVQGKEGAAIAELVEGEMLYMPAGWFHEVTSQNRSQRGGDDGGHLALNYWFHPPDNLDPSAEGFAKPYRCSIPI
jgi:Cupin-like domain